MKRSFCIIQVGPKSNDKYGCKRHREEDRQKREDAKYRFWSDVATSQ